MHGIGNDYVYINGFEETVENPSALAEKVSDRHNGVGGDGLVLILPSKTADVRMRMFNADGSEGKMCGNAIRCVAKLAHEIGLATANPVRIETASGVKTIRKEFVGGKVVCSTVDMGEPMLRPAEIPAGLDAERIVNEPLRSLRLDTDAERILDGPWRDAADLEDRMTCVSMGNPHLVLFCKDVSTVPLEQVGPILERAPIFPDRINVHFVQVHPPACCMSAADELTMRTWERGSGLTLACGTGASAVNVAAVLTERAERTTLIHLPGGDLRIEWKTQDNHVFMTGPAEIVFTGEYLPDLA
jgi:diaminopimelate epimerase